MSMAARGSVENTGPRVVPCLSLLAVSLAADSSCALPSREARYLAPGLVSDGSKLVKALCLF